MSGSSRGCGLALHFHRRAEARGFIGRFDDALRRDAHGERWIGLRFSAQCREEGRVFERVRRPEISRSGARYCLSRKMISSKRISTSALSMRSC